MNKTKRLLSGVLSTSLALAACSNPEHVQYETETIEETSEPLPAEKEFTSSASEYEVELDAYEDDFPNVDLEAVEDYLEDNNITYEEDELLDYLEDLNENGRPSEEHHFASSFPWWVFLLSAKASKPKTSTTKAKSSQSSTSSSKSSTAPSTSSGFGTGTKGGATGS